MRLRYWELVGKKIISADGKEVGRIADLLAQRQGNELRVVAMRVGSGAFIQRIGFKKMRGKETPALEIPWEQIARLEKHIYLNVKNEDLHAPLQESRGEKNNNQTKCEYKNE